MAKIQGHRNPFGKALLDYTEAELDFVLEMEALDNPKTHVFQRGGVATDGSHIPVLKAAWASLRSGKALDAFFAGIPFAMVAAARARRAQGGMIPGIKAGRGAKSAKPVTEA